MGMLVIALIAIALFAFAMMAGVNYLNINSIQAQSIGSSAVTQFALVGSAADRYRTLYGSNPQEMSDLVPRFFTGASPIPTMTWTISADGRWACLTGTATATEVDGLYRAADSIKAPTLILSSVCGATTSFVHPTAFPAEISATLWLRP